MSIWEGTIPDRIAYCPKSSFPATLRSPPERNRSPLVDREKERRPPNPSQYDWTIRRPPVPISNPTFPCNLLILPDHLTGYKFLSETRPTRRCESE